MDEEFYEGEDYDLWEEEQVFRDREWDDDEEDDDEEELLYV